MFVGFIMTRGYMTWGCLGFGAGVALCAFVAQGSNSGVALLSTNSQHSFRDV
jgi:hypothetical protein